MYLNFVFEKSLIITKFHLIKKVRILHEYLGIPVLQCSSDIILYISGKAIFTHCGGDYDNNQISSPVYGKIAGQI